MQGYFIKVGDNKQGPYLSKAAAAAEAKALKEKGYDVKVVQQVVSETALFEALGNPEAEIEIDTEDELDFDAIFDEADSSGDEDEDGDEDGSEDDDEGDEGDGSDDDGDDDSEPEDSDEDEDEAPSGVHGWFKSWGGN